MSVKTAFPIAGLVLTLPLAALAVPSVQVRTTRAPIQGLIKIDPEHIATHVLLGDVQLARLPWGFWVPPCAKSGALQITLYDGTKVNGPTLEVLPASVFSVTEASPTLQMGEPHRQREAGFGWHRGDEIILRGQGFTEGMHVRFGMDDDLRIAATYVSPTEINVVVPLTRRRGGHYVMVEHPDGRMTPVPNNHGFPSIQHQPIYWPGCPGAKPYQWR